MGWILKIKLIRKTKSLSDWLKTYFNIKVTEIEGKIPSNTGLATNSELTAVEIKYLMSVV